MEPYDPLRAERDACGIGFVADARGRASRAIVEAALEGLRRVRHRGAVAADALTGDGAGMLLPIPHDLLGSEDPDHTGLAMCFLDPADRETGMDLVAAALRAEGLELVAWRTVPTNVDALGAQARATMPVIEQAIVRRPFSADVEDGERRAFRARRRIDALATEARVRVYVASFSFRTVTYKAMCAADQLERFYPDLGDDRFVGWFALFHQRYSTNTTPTWERAQPFRFLAHNGEINTIRGNVALLRARERDLGADDLAPEELLRPIVDPKDSDSGILDSALELLVRGGRSLEHAAAMLVPPAWENDAAMDAEARDFFAYHACLLEPWDGPAGLVFADGRHVGACLDRNGLRPLRVHVCEDGLVAVASEAGAVPVRGHGRVRRLKLGPGEALCIDPAGGGLLMDDAVKARLARARPYGDWLAAHSIEMSAGVPVDDARDDVTARQVAAGYTKEEFTVVLRPMAIEGYEPTSSMGDDTAQPPLTRFPRGVFAFLKQRFAQVTNPPIDHLRERYVMSISTRLGHRGRLLNQRPEAAALKRYPSFFLYPSAVEELLGSDAAEIDATFDLVDGPEGLAARCAQLTRSALTTVSAGADVLVITHRAVGSDRVPVPSPLAIGAIHTALVADGLRSRVGLIADVDDARDSHHIAVLLTLGTDAVCPHLALRSIAALAARGRLGGGVASVDAQENYRSALEDGVMKILSKMGISTLDSYRGAQIVEAIGLGHDVVEACFPGVASALGGLSFDELGADAIVHHDAGFGAKPVLTNPGSIKFKAGGEYHAFNPGVIDELQATVGVARIDEDEPVPVDPEMAAAHELRKAVRGDDAAYARFAALVNDRPPTEPRDLLDLVTGPVPVPLDDVEPASDIARRFSTGAMSHGALSAEAHETLSIALNMIGGMANTGEGGEAPERYADERNSGIKQIASGRFGVTPAYLAHARELQIKMAQGSKPGEGGQIPGIKVTEEIARLRHTVPGVALISPPPHHDIYSIEDLAQLIFDLKQANDQVAVSVKLVASDGVGTIAAGVVKGLADVVHIAGGDGGTGASPLSSIKNAGMPWEIGLVETQQALVANGLRGRVRLRVDGGFKTGRDVVVAALLGADEFSFGTAALVAEGCILVRTCHRNTCPVGIATQDLDLRKKFAGTPDMVARYLMHVAEEARLLLASLGLRSLDDAIGRTDLLAPRATGDVRADSLDVTLLLAEPGDGDRRFTGSLPIQRPRSALGDRLHDDAIEGLRAGEAVELDYTITTADRSVGARLGGELAQMPANQLPGRVLAHFTGEAGQSFGAFLALGIDLRLTGEANDYVGKGMGGGRIVVAPPENDGGEPVLVGNTVLYGATGGQLYVAGRAGERFAVRNSGAVAVVEGTGDHACEYMTAGAVVVLGPTGRNFGAGMSGGEAYVFDPDDELAARLNPQLIAAYAPSAAQLESLKRIVARHHELTGSKVAGSILDEWDIHAPLFKRVAPVAEVARLEALFEGTAVSAA